MNKINPLWIVLGAIGLVVVVVVGMYVSASNGANRAEQGIIASNDQSRNVLGQYTPKLTEALGVTKLQASAVADIFTKANQSRYGADGSKASVQWIHEQNPSLDQSNYGKVIALIEAGRDDFAAAQQDKIDRIRQYRTALGNIPGGTFMRWAGYPTPGFFDKYGTVVVSQHASDAFQTGIDNGVNTQAM